MSNCVDPRKNIRFCSSDVQKYTHPRSTKNDRGTRGSCHKYLQPITHARVNSSFRLLEGKVIFTKAT